MKRRLLSGLAFCIGGAVITVLVAWGFAIWARPVNTLPGPERQAPASALARFGRHAGLEQKHQDVRAAFRKALGLSVYFLAAGHGWGQPLTREVFAGFPFLCLNASYAGNGIDMLIRSATEKTSYAIQIPWNADEIWFGDDACASRIRELPLRPVLPGFLTNTILYATLLWAIIRGPWVVRRAWRLRRGRCAKCAYPMGESARCTECGHSLPIPD